MGWTIKKSEFFFSVGARNLSIFQNI